MIIMMKMVSSEKSTSTSEWRANDEDSRRWLSHHPLTDSTIYIYIYVCVCVPCLVLCDRDVSLSSQLPLFLDTVCMRHGVLLILAHDPMHGFGLAIAEPIIARGLKASRWLAPKASKGTTWKFHDYIFAAHVQTKCDRDFSSVVTETVTRISYEDIHGTAAVMLAMMISDDVTDCRSQWFCVLARGECVRSS